MLGEEAHIIAKSEAGPRGAAGARDRIDSYANLILLCPEDHKRVDDQPDVYPVDRLREIKRAHEQAAEDRQDGVPGVQPIKMVRGADEDSIPFKPLLTGADVWGVVAGAAFFNLLPLEGAYDADRVDVGDEFLDTIKDWGEIADAVATLTQQRDAHRSIAELLEKLWRADVYVWGRRLQRTITGGVGAPAPVFVAEVLLLAKEKLIEDFGVGPEDVPPSC